MNFRKLICHFLLLSGISYQARAAILKGSIKPAPSEKKIYLYVFLGDQLRKQDSCELKGGKFEFKSLILAFN
jgi:hypothetical protein